MRSTTLPLLLLFMTFTDLFSSVNFRCIHVILFLFTPPFEQYFSLCFSLCYSRLFLSEVNSGKFHGLRTFCVICMLAKFHNFVVCMWLISLH